MPRVIERPDLIRCEYAARKCWATPFRGGAQVGAEDDKARFQVADGSFQRLVRNCWQFIPDWFKEALPESFVQG
jgi:hypothetical protein